MQAVRRIFSLLLLSALATLWGCATIDKAPESADQSAKQFSAVPGGSVIYVYRNESLGAALSMPVTINGKPAGTTGARSYLRLELPVGTHNLTSQGDGSKLAVTTEPGKVYYVWQEVKMGLMSGGSKLQLVPEDVGKKGVMESALIQAAK
jgi:Protein of unknown function (DUF2846)